MNRNVLPVLISLALTACFSPVPEAQCLRDLDCDAGTCVDTRCVARGTGGGGTNTGGGTNVGGGGTGGSGGGINVGGGGTGGSGGGINVGGGVGGGMGGSGGGVNVGGGTGGSGGGGPVGGGGGSGVDAGICNCRDGLGGCQPGNSPIACGTNGSQCMACGFGQQCQNGACVSGACGPQSCAGCCTNNFCVVPGQQSRFACGLQGQACAQCPMGQSCQNGSCATPVCDVVTCPTGCCANGQCDTSGSRFSCGVAGQMCMRCPMGQACTGGVCLPTFGMDAGVPDAGMTVAVGSACTSTIQCQPPFNANCIQEVLGGQATGYTGGYCTRQCSSNNPCGAGSVCITESFFGAAQSTCRATCAQVGQQSSCRTGYVCAPSMNSTTGFCRARCDVMGALSACAPGQMCNVSTGVCQ